MRKKLLVAIIPLAMRLFVMQLLILNIVFTCYAKNGNGQEVLNKKVSISITNGKLKDLFRKIESSADVKFVFSSGIVDVNRKLSVSVVDRDLGDLLNQLLPPYKISYRVIDGQIVLYAKNELPAGSLAARTITGHVADSTGAALAGATVQVKATGNKTLTDGKGVPDGGGELFYQDACVGLGAKDVTFHLP